MGFFGILFTVLGILFLVGFLRFFFRFLLPVILQVRALRRAQKDFFRGQAPGGQAGRPGRREGEVTVDGPSKERRKPIIREGLAETVDYEEVE